MGNIWDGIFLVNVVKYSIHEAYRNWCKKKYSINSRSWWFPWFRSPPRCTGPTWSWTSHYLDSHHSTSIWTHIMYMSLISSPRDPPITGVYNHLRNAKYLDSTLPFSEGEPGSLGITVNVVCLASHVSYISYLQHLCLDLSHTKTNANRIRPRVFFSWGGSTKSIIDLHLFTQVFFVWRVFMHPSFP